MAANATLRSIARRPARMIATALAISLLGSIASPAIAADATWKQQKQAYVSALGEYRSAMIDRKMQINAIRLTFLTVAKAAQTLPATERRAAVTKARAERDAAITALGAAPVRPVRPTVPLAAPTTPGATS